MAELSPGQVDTILSVVKLVTALAGLFIVYLGARAFRKTRQRHVLLLTMGMFVLTIGAVSEGLALRGLGWSIDQSHIFEAVVTLAGFLILVYSVVAK